MKNRHLTDTEIQQYALETDTCAKALVEHIQHCGHCRQEVMAYQLLSEGIEAQEKAVFEFNVVELVMEQLPQPQPRTTDDRPFIYAIAAIVALMMGLVAYEFSSSLSGLFAYLQPVLVALVIIASLGIMLFLGVDMYRRYKAQMKALNFY